MAGRADVPGQFHLPFFVGRRIGPEPVAAGTGSVRAVEGKVSRLKVGETDVADRAAETPGKIGLLPVLGQDQDLAFSQVDRFFDGFFQAGSVCDGRPEVVDQDLSGMGTGFGQDDLFLQVPKDAVQAQADEALLPETVEEPVVFALASLDDRGQDSDPALGRVQDPGHDLVGRLGADGPAAGRAMRRADPGEEQPEEVVHLGHGPDRGPGIGRNRLLVDGDGRGQSLDGFDLGFFHHVHVLPGVGRHALDIAALALGKQGVEGQGGLPGPGRTGDDDEFIPRKAGVDPL